MKSQRWLAPAALWVALALLLAPAGASAQQSIAFVDTARAAATSSEGKAAQKRLADLRDQKRDEFQPLDEELRRLQEEYETQRFVLSKEALQDREIEILKKRRNLERRLEEAQEEFEIEQRKLMQPILNSIREVVVEVAREKGYDVILERTSPGVLFYSDKLDITDDVILRLNQEAS